MSATNAPPPVDMTTKIGGRTFVPALPVVDGAAPTEVEQGFQDKLKAWTDEKIPLEPASGIRRRERVLDQMTAISRAWITDVCKAKGMPPDVVEAAGGTLFTSGSYRLGVHEPGADIDTILVAPNMCHRGDFFGTSTVTESNPHRDPNSLAERIRRHPDVQNFVAVESAAVPILTFDWDGINIDLLFARVQSASVGSHFDIDNDAVLDGADSATEKSLNGPRVTNLIAGLVAQTPARYQTFLTVVRCIRKWAKARGLYSNKMGYWGGVNINIAVAITLQLYPNACPASLLRRFFLVFKTWRWPQPVMLVKPHDAGYGLPVWSPTTAHRQVAPMITPAYPAMNSTLAVSRQTLQILQTEFERGHAIVDRLWKEYQKNPEAELDWGALFEPSDFFIAYPVRTTEVLNSLARESITDTPCSRPQRYLSLCIVGPTQADAQAWAGFVESRLRKLVSDLLGRSLPLKKIQLWPKKIEACIADQGAILTLSQRQNSISYFVGFEVDRLRMRGNQLNLEMALQNFREWELGRFQPLIPGMDILCKTFGVKELPKICFEGIYEDGKPEAMKKRRRIRDADPERQERKRQQRYEELKAKMAVIQRKKEEQKKRKREEVDIEDEVAAAVVKEETNETVEAAEEQEEAVEATEETNLLESALDTFGDEETGEAKTREQAEVDRRKLLAGEMLEEEEGVEEGNASDEDDYGYTTGRDRHSILMKPSVHRDSRSLPVPEQDAEILRKLGYAVVSDDEAKIIGADLIPPWQAGPPRESKPLPKLKIRFREKFDIVELDALGHVIDKGDEDFTPSKSWTGRRAGFEFKLGERGLGYYRTGKKVVVPSNNAY